ncbi:ABC transporter substrate-binding protein [Luteipulveratus flavus]|uniref:ABC transporter substrate-binding protein n=1 Tax=Luteipulveratus flavus TaxID=3031728 RepID=A0ABT6C9I6_9MICO|nr:ABC transporter substrate-binding protein [Luteipulveratus sp. YIM 133296]MDF8264972.1 ABC transporter substrate-binding protein [Luteipulveratus sp. YIM 133296]
MKVNRKAAAVAAASAAVLALASCASSDRDSGSGSSSGGGGGGGTLTFGAAGAPAVFDPFYASDGETFRVTRQLYDTLVMFKPGTADMTPALAESWNNSPDGKTWTFNLRSGVKFSDGTALDATAVCKNFERWYNQTADGLAGAEYWSSNFGGSKVTKEPSLYKSCTPTSNKVVVQLNRVTSKFPSVLGLPSFSIQSPTAMDKYKANDLKGKGEGIAYPEYAKSHPTGSGPFTLEKYDTANQTITLKRNANYWGDKAKIDKLVFKIIPNESSRKQALEAGEIDGYDFPNPADWNSLKQNNDLKVRPAFNVLYLGLNAKANPKLKDLKVRQALMTAINRPQLVKSQLPEGAKVADEFMPDTVDGYNTSPTKYTYDVNKAKQMLQQAGAAGMQIELWYPSEVSRPYMPNPQKIFDAIKKDWEAAGLKVKPVTKPWNGGYLDAVDNGDASSFLLGWTGDYNTADNFIGTFFTETTNRFQTGQYPWGKQLSAELTKADSTVDEADRTAQYKTINNKLVTEYLPGLPISHSPPAIVFNKKVSGITPSPLTDERYNYAEIKK